MHKTNINNDKHLVMMTNKVPISFKSRAWCTEVVQSEECEHL
jgi:hypothetical protein